MFNVPAQAQVREEGYMSWVCRRVRLAIRFTPRKNPLLREQRIGAEVRDQEEIEVSLCGRDTLWMGKISFTQECPPFRNDHLRVDDESTEDKTKLGELEREGYQPGRRTL